MDKGSTESEIHSSKILRGYVGQFYPGCEWVRSVPDRAILIATITRSDGFDKSGFYYQINHEDGDVTIFQIPAREYAVVTTEGGAMIHQEFANEVPGW